MNDVCNENTVNNPCCHGYDNQILVTLAPGSVKLAPGADCICSCKSNCHTIMTKYCAILKSEYEQLKVSRKALKSDFDKFKRDSITKETLLKDTTKEVKQLGFKKNIIL
jgi:hypothetical protein